MKRLITTFPAILFGAIFLSTVVPVKISVSYDKGIPALEFAVNELQKACKTRNIEFLMTPDKNSIGISFAYDKTLGKEAYRIEQKNNTLLVTGGDANGLMYAGIELAENIQAGKDLLKTGTLTGAPYMPYRGIKFNIPLDARTPSYDDTGDAAQNNIETMWEFDFWKNFLDNMARYRYNLLTLWSLHPYPSMVKVPGYEDVALNDVCVYTGPVTYKTNMKWKGENNQNPNNLKVVKKITIDEKIVFWQKVFKYADDRGIDIHMYHWNVFVNGAEGKYGIQEKQDSPITTDYMKKSVKQFLLTYPTIKGIGVTAGENVNNTLKGEYSTENWIWLTYGKAIMEARAINPEINVTFIFRQHQSDMNLIADAFKDYKGPFDTEFKYSRARMFSSTTQPWFDKIYREQVEKYKIKVWMNVRNDDIFTFRWGNPEYANTFIRNMPKSLMSGYFWGPDGYVYGHVFNSKNAEALPKYEIDKQWFMFMIWGRAGYNPDLPSSFYIDRISAHFPGIDANLLYNTWKSTSDVIEWVDKIHFRQNDAEFLAESCFDIVRFHDVNNFCRQPCMPEQGVSSIGDFVLNGKVTGELTPFEVAEKLDKASKNLLEGAAEIKAGNNMELQETLGDLISLGYLAQYYAHKVRGATNLSQFRLKGDEKYKSQAVSELKGALASWISYSNSATTYYKPQLFARTQMLDWNATIENVKEDVNIAINAKKGEPVSVSGTNKIWERDMSKQ
jgi:Glycosyl hydrolase family 20, domain 2